MVLLHNNVASAVQTQPLAKRDVNIYGKRRRRPAQRGDQHSSVTRLPVGRRRITRVSRCRCVVALEQFDHVNPAVANARALPRSATLYLQRLETRTTLRAL